MIKYIYHLLGLKKHVPTEMYTYTDNDIGDLRRVGGLWRVENPKKTLGVSVKIMGSDESGPNRKALETYKLYRGEFESIWSAAIIDIKHKIEQDHLYWKNPNAEYLPLEIIFGDPEDYSCEMSIAFHITTVSDNEFSANFNEQRYVGFGSMCGPPS